MPVPNDRSLVTTAFWVGDGAITGDSCVGGDDVAGDSETGAGIVTTGSCGSEDDVTGESGVGDGAMAKGSGAGEGVSVAAIVHPADSNITSVSGIRIIDSFFIFNPPSLSSVGYSLFSITTIYNVRLRY